MSGSSSGRRGEGGGGWGCFFFSSRRRHTRLRRDWSSDVCSSDLVGSRTLPIAIGIRNTKTVLVVLILITMILLAYVQSIFHFNLMVFFIVFFYLFVLVQMPLVFITIKLLNNNSKRVYHLIGQVMKSIMVVGILFTIVLNYQITLV